MLARIEEVFRCFFNLFLMTRGKLGQISSTKWVKAFIAKLVLIKRRGFLRATGRKRQQLGAEWLMKLETAHLQSEIEAMNSYDALRKKRWPSFFLAVGVFFWGSLEERQEIFLQFLSSFVFGSLEDVMTILNLISVIEADIQNTKPDRSDRATTTSNRSSGRGVSHTTSRVRLAALNASITVLSGPAEWNFTNLQGSSAWLSSEEFLFFFLGGEDADFHKWGYPQMDGL